MAVSLGYFDTLLSASAASTSSELNDTELEAAGKPSCSQQASALALAGAGQLSDMRWTVGIMPILQMLCAAGIGGGLVRKSVGLTGTVEQRWEQLEEAYRHVAQKPVTAMPQWKAAQVGLFAWSGLRAFRGRELPMPVCVGVCGGRSAKFQACADGSTMLALPLRHAAPVQVTLDAATGELKRTPSWHSFGSTADSDEGEEEEGDAEEDCGGGTEGAAPAAVSAAGAAGAAGSGGGSSGKAPSVRVRRVSTCTEVVYTPVQPAVP